MHCPVQYSGELLCLQTIQAVNSTTVYPSRTVVSCLIKPVTCLQPKIDIWGFPFHCGCFDSHHLRPGKATRSHRRTRASEAGKKFCTRPSSQTTESSGTAGPTTEAQGCTHTFLSVRRTHCRHSCSGEHKPLHHLLRQCRHNMSSLRPDADTHLLVLQPVHPSICRR